jgi:major membrane immunogen (membrane-anchored lipoprotein)
MTRFLALLPALLLTACGSKDTAMDKSTAASTDVGTFRKNIETCRSQVETTINALNSMSTAQGDLKPPYEKFGKECDKLQEQADATRAQADAVRAAGRRHFEKWEAEVERIQDPELKAKTLARREERAKEYGKIEDNLQAAKTSFSNFGSGLKDLRAVLGADLSPKGISAASGAFTKTNLQGVEVRKHLDSILAIVDKLAAELSGRR